MAVVLPSTINWGILTCGKISNDFVNALKSVKGAQITSCGARKKEDALSFGKVHGIPNCYGSYEELVKDPLVQIVYVGSIHPYHYEHTLLALNHGKHVLVEKPVAINRKQAEVMFEVAAEKQLFIMEGTWTIFFPAFVKALELIAAGEIGEIHYAQSDFGVPLAKDVQRIWDPILGGGGVLDLGVYPITQVAMLLANNGKEKPLEIKATGVIHQGVDVCGSVTLKFPNNKMAMQLGIRSYKQKRKPRYMVLRDPSNCTPLPIALRNSLSPAVLGTILLRKYFNILFPHLHLE